MSLLKPILLGAATIASLLSPVLSSAQSQYPTKPINFIVPYGAGGGADSRSRQIAQKMSILLNQPIIVDNKPGAGGNIGTEFIARAAPDGYTIGMGNFAPMAVNKTLFGNLRYDPETDLSPIVLIEKGPLVLVVNPSSPYKTVKDIIDAAKAKPGELTFSSGGIGGSHQLSAELFKQSAGIDMIHVPYKSGSAGLTDLMAGNVTMMFDQMYSAMPSIKADKLRPIAITSKKRSPLFPTVPTAIESGIVGLKISAWWGLVAPPGTPSTIIKQLNEAVNYAASKDPLKARLAKEGALAYKASPKEFQKMLNSELKMWQNVVKSTNLKVD